MSVVVVRLSLRSICDAYEVEHRWQGTISDADYRALANSLAPLAIPPANTFTVAPPGGVSTQSSVSDGTGVELRMTRGPWRVRRSMNLYANGSDGADARAISAMFRALIARYVPREEMPSEVWRLPSR